MSPAGGDGPVCSSGDDTIPRSEIIIDGLKKRYDDRLVMLIPRLKTNNPEQLEKVLRQRVNRSAIGLYCGARWGNPDAPRQQWQEASIAFRAALKQRPDAL